MAKIDAKKYAKSRVVTPTTEGSFDIRTAWGEDIMRRSLFSSRCTNAEILQDVSDKIDDLLSGKYNEATARAELQMLYRELDYNPERGFPGDVELGIPPAKEGSLLDLSSNQRIKLVLQTNEVQASNFAYRERGMDASSRWQYPAWELVRVYTKQVERGFRETKDGLQPVDGDDWPSRWEKAGGRLVGGRMVALKDDDIWNNLGSSRLFDDGLDNPYPPFAFGSGMGIVEVDRADCMDLGLVTGDEVPEASGSNLNDNLKVGVEKYSKEMLQAILKENDIFVKNKELMLKEAK